MERVVVCAALVFTSNRPCSLHRRPARTEGGFVERDGRWGLGAKFNSQFNADGEGGYRGRRGKKRGEGGDSMGRFSFPLRPASTYTHMVVLRSSASLPGAI